MDNNPGKLGGIIAVTIFAFALGFIGLGHVVMGLLGAAMILASTAEFWLGTWYRVDEAGVKAKTGLSLTAMEWADVKRVEYDEASVRLLPLEVASWRDSFRGVSLKFGADNRDRIEQAIGRFVPNG